MTQLVPRQSAALGPASHLARLVRPYRDIPVDLTGDRILYFLKVGAKAGSVSARSLPPDVARQVAMLTIHGRKGTFSLHWYPHGEEPQVASHLPMERLGEAVQDLSMAGWGAPPEVTPAQPEPKQRAIPCNTLTLEA